MFNMIVYVDNSNPHSSLLAVTEEGQSIRASPPVV